MLLDIVFEGGGAKGMAFVGALRAIEEAGFTYRRLVGTSAGSIVAALVAAGYDSASLEEVMAERLPDGRPRFAGFKDPARQLSLEELRASVLGRLLTRVDIPLIRERTERKIEDALLKGLARFSLFRTLMGLTERGGLHPGDDFCGWLDDRLADKGLGQITLAGLHERNGMHLTAVASDVSASQQLLLNHLTAPDVPVCWAVRMSMGIPFLFEETQWRSEWGQYLGTNITGHAVVDGGLLSNFPLELITADDDRIQSVMGGDPADEAGTLGLLIDEGREVPGQETGSDSESGLLSEVQFDDRLGRLVNAMTDARDRAVIAQHEEFVCRLPAKGYATTDFELSQARREALIAAAYAVTAEHLDGPD